MVIGEEPGRDRRAPAEHAGGDGIEHPRPAHRLGAGHRRRHGFGCVGLRRAEVDQHPTRDAGEVTRFRRVVDHRWARADRKQHVGGEVRDDDVGQALHQRRALVQCGRRGTELLGLDRVCHERAGRHHLPPRSGNDPQEYDGDTRARRNTLNWSESAGASARGSLQMIRPARTECDHRHRARTSTRRCALPHRSESRPAGDCWYATQPTRRYADP